MGYTNGSAYTLTANLTGPATVADAQYYTEDVYTKALTLNTKLRVTNVTVESGGTMATPNNTGSANSTTCTGITVGNSGSVSIKNYNNALGFTVHSGGYLYTGNYVKLYNAVISSGAKWSKTNVTSIGGRETNIEQGVQIANNMLGDDFFIKDGVVSNLNQIRRPTAAITNNSMAHFYAIDIDGGVVNSGASMYLSLGVKASGGLTIRSGGVVSAISDTNNTGSGAVVNGAVVESGGSLFVGNYAYAINLQARSGAIFNYYGDNTVIGGAETNIERGTVKGNVFGADFFVSGGVAYDLEVTTRQANFRSGLNVSGGVVYAGGSLLLGSGVNADGVLVSGANAVLSLGQKGSLGRATVADGGAVSVFDAGQESNKGGAHADSITVRSGGFLRVGNHNSAADLLVLSGGSVYTGNSVRLYNADIRSGAMWSKTNQTQICGRETNIEQGVQLANNILGANFFVKDGVASNLDLIKHPSVNWNSEARFYAIDIDKGIVNSGAILMLSLGVLASGGLTIRGGGVAIWHIVLRTMSM